MLTKLLDLAERQARTILTELHQDLVPSWVIITENNEPVIIPTPWRNDNEKHLAELFIRFILKEYKAKAYSLVTEAWAAAAPKDWDPDTPLPEYERASRQVNRQEIVIAFATDGKTTKWRQWLTYRNWKGDVDALKQREITNEDQFTSWMTDLF